MDYDVLKTTLETLSNAVITLRFMQAIFRAFFLGRIIINSVKIKLK